MKKSLFFGLLLSAIAITACSLQESQEENNKKEQNVGSVEVSADVQSPNNVNKKENKKTKQDMSTRETYQLTEYEVLAMSDQKIVRQLLKDNVWKKEKKKSTVKINMATQGERKTLNYMRGSVTYVYKADNMPNSAGREFLARKTEGSRKIKMQHHSSDCKIMREKGFPKWMMYNCVEDGTKLDGIPIGLGG